MRARAVLIALALVLAPLAADAADLVVWWDEPWYAEEEEALAAVVDAFEQGTGKQVEVAFYPAWELPAKIMAALEAGRPPDFAYGLDIIFYIPQWAFEDRLVDLSDAVGTFSNVFDADALASVTLVNDTTGQRALYGLPIGRSTVHIHVWKSLLEQAGFTLDDIPKEWDAFWSFWCDQVQPAVRRATGRHDIWGVGLNMSGEPPDTQNQFFQFLSAYDAHYVTRDGRLVIDDPEVRRRLIEAIDAYTARRPLRRPGDGHARQRAGPAGRGLRPEALLDGERIDYGDRRSRRARRDRMAIAFQQYIQGRLVDEGPPAQIFGGARTERARASVGRLLRH